MWGYYLIFEVLNLSKQLSEFFWAIMALLDRVQRLSNVVLELQNVTDLTNRSVMVKKSGQFRCFHKGYNLVSVCEHDVQNAQGKRIADLAE